MPTTPAASSSTLGARCAPLVSPVRRALPELWREGSRDRRRAARTGARAMAPPRLPSSDPWLAVEAWPFRERTYRWHRSRNGTWRRRWACGAAPRQPLCPQGRPALTVGRFYLMCSASGVGSRRHTGFLEKSHAGTPIASLDEERGYEQSYRVNHGCDRGCGGGCRLRWWNLESIASSRYLTDAGYRLSLNRSVGVRQQPESPMLIGLDRSAVSASSLPGAAHHPLNLVLP